MRKYFLVTLLEDAVVSHRAASIGGHSGLDYVPGATLLGAVAAVLYNALSPAEQFTIFHSGKVRFSDALPLRHSGHTAYPMPLCWYHGKHDKPGKTGCKRVLNRQFDDVFGVGDDQPEQYRNVFYTFNGQCFKPEKQLRMKTAVDFTTGTAATGQLFGYSALPKGSAFWCKVEADDGAITPERFAEIAQILHQGVRVGRSRSAEYGRVKVQALPEEYAAKLDLPPPPAGQTVNIWLLADTALQDANGQPSLYPDAGQVGLPSNFILVPEKTFIRTRSYTPFNSTRRRRELERQVLSQGSVLHFSGAQAVELAALQAQGIGLYRQYGLGRIWINPECLENPEPHLKNSKLSVKLETFLKPERVDSEPDDIVFRYLRQRQEQMHTDDGINAKITEWEQELKQAYQSALALEPHFGNVCVGPSKSQWGRIMQAAVAATGKEALFDELFFKEEGKRAICKEHDAQWDKRIYYHRKPELNSFRKWFKHKLNAEHDNPLLLKIVARFAGVARTIAEKSGCRMEREENQ